MKTSKRNALLIGLFLIGFGIYQASNSEFFNFLGPESEEMDGFQELNFLGAIKIDREFMYQEMCLLNNKTIVFASETYDRPYMYDVSDPTDIIDLGEITSIDNPKHIAASGDLLFVADPFSIKAYNMSDINNPVEYKEYTTQYHYVFQFEIFNGHLFSIFYYSDRAYMGIYNITDASYTNWTAPSVEMVIEQFLIDDSGIAILVHNDGLMFLNITNTSAPELMGEIETPDFPTAFGYHEGILYLSDAAGLHVYNATDPAKITKIEDYFGEDYYYTKILTYKDVLFGSNKYKQGMKALDISDCRNIRISVNTKLLSPDEVLIHDKTIIFYANMQDPKAEPSPGEPTGDPNELFLVYFDLSDEPNADVDGDGLNFIREVWTLGTDVNKVDTDGDGLPDNYEAIYYNAMAAMSFPGSTLIPTVADSDNDVDGDGLTNLEEFQYGTNPMKSDTDGDQASDGYEVKKGTDPLDSSSVPPAEIDPGLIVFAVIGLSMVGGMVLSSVLKKKSPLNIFLSHAVINFEPYKIKEMSETLQTLEPVNKALYCELDMKGNIDEWMDEMVPLSHIFVFLSTQKSVFKSPDCAREIRLAKENGLMLLPLRTDEVQWEDIGKIGLPTNGFDYSEGNSKEVFDKLKDYIKGLSVKMEKLLKVLKKNDIINLPSLDSPLEFEQGEASKLGKILIKSKQIVGVISRTGDNFMSESEVKRMLKIYQKQKPESSTQELMGVLNIDPIYEHEVESLLKKPKTASIKVYKNISSKENFNSDDLSEKNEDTAIATENSA
jgi:hypothetical protein